MRVPLRSPPKGVCQALKRLPQLHRWRARSSARQLAASADVVRPCSQQRERVCCTEPAAWAMPSSSSTGAVNSHRCSPATAV